MKYNKIRKMDISNGPGVRVSIFMQGCAFHCKDCFNPETWDFNNGNDFNKSTILKVLDLCDETYIRGLSILGGEPLHPSNIKGTLQLAKEFKTRFPNKDLWVWTGYLFENLCERKDVNIDSIKRYIDFLVDGQFQEDKKNPTLRYAGSENQRCINIKETFKKGKIVTLSMDR